MCANSKLESPGLTRDEALARARELAPRIRERSERCMAQRSVPVETVQELKAAGLVRLMQPKAYGGSELGRDVVCEVIQILAPACASQAWVYHVLADHAWMLGTYTAQAQQDVWGEDPDTLMSSSFAPLGRARAVEGGFIVSGRHGFSSGIDHVDWVVCGGVVQGAGEARHFMIPKADGTVIDDWDVNGLEGTGSKTFLVDEVFVPAHRTIVLADAVAGKGPGSLVNTEPLYRAPRFGYTSSGFAALVVGMARGLLDDWLTYAAKRGGGLSARKESMQMLAGQAASEIASAELLYLSTIRDATRRINEGENLSEGGVYPLQGHFAYAVQLVLAATMRLYNASGAMMIYRGNAMERQFRNIMAAVQHISIDWPTGSAGHGAHLLRHRGAAL